MEISQDSHFTLGASLLSFAVVGIRGVRSHFLLLSAFCVFSGFCVAGSLTIFTTGTELINPT